VQEMLVEEVVSSPTKTSQTGSGFGRKRIIALCCVLAVSAVTMMAALGPAGFGWDAQAYGKAIHSLRQGSDPYADALAEQKAFHEQPPSVRSAHHPFTYIYPPLTLPLLRLAAILPDKLLVVLFGTALAAGFLLQLWAGFQMATKDERRWLPVMLPFVAFFPGLLSSDIILSGNVAFILNGLLLATAVIGWKRGRWFWYYGAVLAAAMFKPPALTLLLFPLLVGRKQWLSACAAAMAGLFLFSAQVRIWPELFREHLLVVQAEFDWNHHFGLGPAGMVANALWKSHRPYLLPAAVVYVAFATLLVIALLMLSRRVRIEKIAMQSWVPIALIGTFLLNPRLVVYDVAAVTVPMLLIGWRGLRSLQDGSGFLNNNALTRRHPDLSFVLFGLGCFVTLNVVAGTGEAWQVVELVVLMVVLALGIWLLGRPTVEHPAGAVSASLLQETYSD